MEPASTKEIKEETRIKQFNTGEKYKIIIINLRGLVDDSRDLNLCSDFTRRHKSRHLITSDSYFKGHRILPWYLCFGSVAGGYH